MIAETILSKYETHISILGFQLRDFLIAHLPGITEEADGAANLLGYGYGAGYKNMICTILPSKKGIKLGLYKGSELPDPTGLLTGSGKVHKYVEIKINKDLENPALEELLQQALNAYKKRTGNK
jgi:hypothetical protein